MRAVSALARRRRIAGGFGVATTAAQAALSAEELAKLAQNPVGNLISEPFQNNTNFDVGPQQGTQNILNIQPVIPVSIDQDWSFGAVKSDCAEAATVSGPRPGAP